MALAIGVALGLCLVVCGSAFGATGRIVRAQASADWTQGSIAGVVYRTIECVEPPVPIGPDPPYPGWPGKVEDPIAPPEYFPLCDWIPYATVGPAAQACSSSARRLSMLGDGVQLVWSGGERTGVGAAAFDLPAVGLEHGAAAPLLCLSVVEAATGLVVCPALAGFPCPPYAIVAKTYPLDSALLETQPATNPPAASAALSVTTRPAAEPKQALRGQKGRCRKGRTRAKSGPGIDSQRSPGSRPRCRSRHRRPKHSPKN
jgi:hypothetical protein